MYMSVIFSKYVDFFNSSFDGDRCLADEADMRRGGFCSGPRPSLIIFYFFLVEVENF